MPVGKRALAIGAAVLAAAVIAVLVWPRGAGSPEARRGDVAPAAPGAPPSAARAAPRTAALPAPGTVADPLGGRPGVATDDPLTAYRKANVYPPSSRPLGKESVDLLYPNRRHEQVRPTDADDGTAFLFTADRYFVLGDEALTATLTVTRDGQPVPAAIAQAFAAVLDPQNRSPTPIPLAFTAQGPALVARFAPASLGLPRQTALGVYVEFTYGAPAVHQRAHLDFQYTPTAGIPATFTGAFRDAVESGSLVVHTGVAVARAGHYVIDCNLYDAADQPVAWTRWKGDLAPGAQDAPLLFFGKVLTDADARAPFHLGQLRGARFEPGLDPDLEQMPPYAGTFTTAAYPPGAFSDADYDSPDKQKMLQFLSDQQQKGVHQGAAGHGDPGSAGDDH